LNEDPVRGSKVVQLDRVLAVINCSNRTTGSNGLGGSA
jgi:hypothetical protein